MPVIKSAKKKLLQDKKRTARNKEIRNRLQDLVKKALKNPTQKALSEVSKMVDKAAKNHIIHKNKASHIKSRLAKLLSKKTPVKAVKKAPQKKKK